MIFLNFSNVEELIFLDPEVHKLLPAYFHVFEQWKLWKRFPFLRSLEKTSTLDVLNGLTDEDILNLETYFGEKITVERLDYIVTRDLQVKLDEDGICEALCELRHFNYLSAWRDADYLYVSFWR